MKRKLNTAKFWLLLGTVCLALVPGLSAQSANVSVFATGLNNPRGLKFGPKGVNLFVGRGWNRRNSLDDRQVRAGSPRSRPLYRRFYGTHLKD